MSKILKKYSTFINEEVGFRNLSKIVKNYKECEIWFHVDLDGVISGICMKEFLKKYYDIETIDVHKIQYGGMEYATKAGKSDTLKAVCDFSHGKPMFHIHTDHHSGQVGSDKTELTYFKHTRSNAEIISGEISYSDLFTPQDIEMVRTIDSANFLKYNITPDDVQNAIFTYQYTQSPAKNRFMMGFVVNRLLLAYKNKRITITSLDGKREHENRNILECLVLDSNASLYSMFNNLKHYIRGAEVDDRAGVLATPEEITLNLSEYIDKMKNYKFIENPDTGEVTEYDPDNWRHQKILTHGGKIGPGVHYDDVYRIIIQYGGGALFKPGSYDRYVPFKNYPKAEFICIVWPMGLVQVSCNPFIKKNLKNIDLGKLAKEVLAKHEETLRKFFIPIESIKREYETSQDWNQMLKSDENYEGVGFKFSDLKSFYSDCIFAREDNKIVKFDISDEYLEKTMDKKYRELTQAEKDYLSGLKIPVWEIVVRNSGGHPSITNICGLNFMKYNKAALKIAYDTEKYSEVLKIIAREVVNLLKEKIDISITGKEVPYDTRNVELLGSDVIE